MGCVANRDLKSKKARSALAVQTNLVPFLLLVCVSVCVSMFLSVCYCFLLIVVFIYSALQLQDCLINLLVTRYSLRLGTAAEMSAKLGTNLRQYPAKSRNCWSCLRLVGARKSTTSCTFQPAAAHGPRWRRSWTEDQLRSRLLQFTIGANGISSFCR